MNVQNHFINFIFKFPSSHIFSKTETKERLVKNQDRAAILRLENMTQQDMHTKHSRNNISKSSSSPKTFCTLDISCMTALQREKKN